MTGLRALILATTLALAVLAAAFALSASATALCEAEETECTGLNPYIEETTMAASLSGESTATIKTSLGTITCSQSTLAGHTRETEASPLPFDLTGMTLAKCKFGTTECTSSEVINLSYSGSLAWVGSGDGTATIAAGESGKSPGAVLSCKILGFPVTCTATAKEQSWQMNGGSPAHIVAKEASMTITGSGCPTSGTFSAEYAVSEPNPVFVAQKAAHTKLCKEVKVNPCNNAYGALGLIEATASTNPKFELEYNTVKKTVTCTVSTLKAKTNVAEGTPLYGELTDLTFDKCGDGTNNCTVKANNLPYQMAIEASEDFKGTGRVTFRSSGKGHPEIAIVCGAAYTCEFEEEEMRSLRFEGNTGAKLEIWAGMSRTEAADKKCGNLLQWNNLVTTTEYKISNPAAVWPSRG